MIIRLKNVSLGYGREAVLENINLEIPRGVFLPFVGPNGGGKTTLLRGILGLIKPLRGTIETPFTARPAGYVAQYKSIDPLFPLTVKEIISMGFYPRLGWWKRPGAEEKRVLGQALGELGLAKYAHENYRDLSGGTQQKTLIARAFVSGAEVFIMDEPTAELDEASEQEVFRHLAELVTKFSKTVLMAHHGLNRLISSSATSKICAVNHGKIEMMESADLKKRGVS
ncbi:MAG TPA: ATP-binding cassette domain-containing protein [bacterium]|nr:ATP-binding cassette domain-containing protein [bacterium]